jgi:hypothetical protein
MIINFLVVSHRKNIRVTPGASDAAASLSLSLHRISRKGFGVEQSSSDDPDSSEPMSCLACGQVRLVNSKNLGQDSDGEG